MTVHFTNNIMEVPRLGEWIAGVGQTYGLSEDKVFQLNLALEEAVVNCMQYAYPNKTNMPIDLSCRKEDNHLIFLLEDEGQPFDPTKEQRSEDKGTRTKDKGNMSVEEMPLGGLGILLMHEYAQSIHYRRQDGHNLLTITFDI